MRPLEKTHPRDGGQDPRELGDLGHFGLPEERRFFRIEPESEIVERHGADVLPERSGILDRGERVVIRDEEEALAFFLERDVLADRAEVVPEVELSRRLHAGQDAGTGRGRGLAHEARILVSDG